jgi:hypothetical protein
MKVSHFASLPPGLDQTKVRKWRCNLCDASFDTKKALAVHARHKHQYRTQLKYFVFGDECLACGKKFFSRTRLLAHTGASKACKDSYFACFVPAAEEVVEPNVRKESRCESFGLKDGQPPKPFSLSQKLAVPSFPEVERKMQPR